MVPLNFLIPGAWVYAEIDGNKMEGRVMEVSYEKARVDTDTEQEVWCFPSEMDPIPLTEEWLFRFHFIKSSDADANGGGQTYTHGPFILQYLQKGNDQSIELRCHGEHERDYQHGLAVHELQRHYHGMTKVYLEE